jgi:hypothetical protein
VNAKEIRQMRDLLAAQPAPSEPRAPDFHRKLTRFLARKPAPRATVPLALSIDPEPAAARAPIAEDGDFSLPAPDPAASEPVPPELLLVGLAPRRPAFGQRVERVLELAEPAPAEPRRLILCAAGGETVGEIILHQGGTALHAEAPFFPEDLADETFPRPRLKSETPPVQKQPPAPELAETFLLANLAARLASEEAALNHRLAMVRVLHEAA